MNCLFSASVIDFAPLHTEVSGVAAPLSIVATGGIPVLRLQGLQQVDIGMVLQPGHQPTLLPTRKNKQC
jgi:hypothetical protein